MTNEILPEKKPSVKLQFNWHRTGIYICIIALLILLTILSYGYFTLVNVSTSLAQVVTVLQNQGISNQNKLYAMQQTLDSVQQHVDKLPTELQSANTTQNLDDEKWQINHVQHLVQLAQDHLQFTHNSALALTLLERAQTLLQHTEGTNILPLRESLAADIANLKALPAVNITALYVRLTALDQQLDQLPLPATPLAADKTHTVAATEEPAQSWWRRGLQHTWQALSKIIIVRYDATRELPLLLPEEKTFLYQNLHAQLASAIWGLLHQNKEVYQDSLQRLSAWIQRYCAQDDARTTAMLQALQALAKENIQAPTLELDKTLALLAQLISATQTTKAAQ